MNGMTILLRILPVACYVFLALMILGGVYRIVELSISSLRMKQHVRSLRSVDYRRFQDSEHIMPVSLILPATDTQESLRDQVENLLSLEFKQYELIVVANSDHANSWASLKEYYQLLPFQQPYKKTLKSAEVVAIYRSAKDVRLVVLDQRDSNRANALNAGINVSAYPIIAPVYPQLRLTKHALLQAVYAFVSDSSCVFIGSFPRMGAVAGESAQQKQSTLAEYQSIERLRILFTNRAGYAELGIYLPLEQTFAAFLKSAVTEVGGFSIEAKAETADLLMRIQARLRAEKRAYSARLLPDAVCYQTPYERMRAVCAAQRRAQRGMRDTIRKNFKIAAAYPSVFYTRLSEKIWPSIELIGALIAILAAALGQVPALIALLYVLLNAMLGALQSVGAALLEEYYFQRQTETGTLLRRYMLSIAENFGYRLRTAFARIFS